MISLFNRVINFVIPRFQTHPDPETLRTSLLALEMIQSTRLREDWRIHTWKIESFMTDIRNPMEASTHDDYATTSGNKWVCLKRGLITPQMVICFNRKWMKIMIQQYSAGDFRVSDFQTNPSPLSTALRWSSCWWRPIYCLPQNEDEFPWDLSRTPSRIPSSVP